MTSERSSFIRSARGVVVCGLLLALIIGGVCWILFPGKSEKSPDGESGASVVPSVVDREPSSNVQRSYSAVDRPTDPARWGEIWHEGESISVAANVRFEFPRFYLSPGARVEGSATFPQLEPGARVALDAVDSGYLAANYSMLDEDRRAHFELELPIHEGAHRVILRHGSETRSFEFWVGEEPPVVVRRED